MEVIVVDNGSTIDPSQKLLEIMPDVKIILNGKNLGFAAGMNVGLEKATGEYLFVVNNDTEFTSGMLEGLIEVYDEFPKVGLVSPKFQYFFDKGTIEYAGYTKMNPITGRNATIGSKEKDTGQYCNIEATHFPHGGGMMISREVYSKVGGIPEDFGFYYEEFDWAEKIKKLGYQIYVQPKSLIYHKESMSTGKNSPFKTFYQTKNRILFMKKNFSSVYYLLFMCYFMTVVAPSKTGKYIFKKEMKNLHAFWKGILWNIFPTITSNTFINK